MAKKATENRELVEVTPPRVSGNNDANFLIGLNGVNYILPRGKKSMVPKAVAEEFYRAQAAQEKMFEEQEALRNK